MIRVFTLAFGVGLVSCVSALPEPDACVFVETQEDAGVHWFQRPVHAGTGASELENLELRNGLLVPIQPGAVVFTIDTQCQRQRWMGFATDQPFVFSPSALSFPITRPAASSALPLVAINHTDDPVDVALRFPSGFRGEERVMLSARTSREQFIFFEPTTTGTFEGELFGTAFSAAITSVSLRGTGGGPVVNVPARFDAGVVAALGPLVRPDARLVLLSNDAPIGEDSRSNLLLPTTGTSDCANVDVRFEDTFVPPGGSTRVLVFLPSTALGTFDCNITVASAPRPFSFRVNWRTELVPPCDMTWPLSAQPTDAGRATVELVTQIGGCYLTYPRIEPADAGVVLSRWTELDVPPRSRVLVDVFLWAPGDLRINISSPASPTLSVPVVP